MSNHVFVSHSHEDSSAADLIVQALENRGITCWVAPRDVPAGGSYAEAILNAIESASCFVLIYSEHSNVSSHVLREVERALKFGLNIVPVRFDDSIPSKSLDYLLATVHWLSIASDSRDRSILKAAEQIAACVTKPQSVRPVAEQDRVPPSRTPAAPVTSSPKRRSLWIGAAILLALVAGLIAFLVLRKSDLGVSTTTTLSATPQVDQTDMPLAVTHRYFALLNKRNAFAAYNLLSSDFHRRLPLARFSKNVGFAPPGKLVEATTTSKQERTASVTVVFEDTNAESGQRRWRGPIDLVLESGGWRIDRMKGLWPASGRPIHDSANESDDETTPDLRQSAPGSTPTLQATTSLSPVHQAVHGIVEDPDGIANVREQPFGHSKIVTVVKNGERVEIDQMEGDWVHIILGPDKGGFIHKSRVKITLEK